MERHYGMDWLRIGAFALLILYHVGMVFVPWGFEVKTAEPMVWAEIPMFLTSPWRLSLLFVVSGYASRAVLAKQRGVGAFVRSRSARLLIPLLFGVTVLVVPQPWVHLVTQEGYEGSFLHFWLIDYFRFTALSGVIVPTYMHLWFVAYLWVYSLLLAGGLAVLRVNLQPVFDRVFAGSRVLWLPFLYVVLVQTLLFQRSEDTHTLVDDWAAHARYVAMFLFGFGLARSRSVMQSLAAQWKVAAVVAITGYAVIAGLLATFPDFDFPSKSIVTIFRLARDAETWLAIAALTGIAHRFWNHDHARRPILAEAVFPFYIIHQTVIVVVMFLIKPLGLAPLAEFGILVAATVAGCWVFYLGGREIGWLRPLIGLKPRARKACARTGSNARLTMWRVRRGGCRRAWPASPGAPRPCR